MILVGWTASNQDTNSQQTTKQTPPSNQPTSAPLTKPESNQTTKAKRKQADLPTKNQEHWLVVSTPLKNISQNGFIFPK